MELQESHCKIYPFVDKLVDSLFTNEINNLIGSEVVQEDRHTFMMFIVMYFTIKTNANLDVSKKSLKIFMSDIIKDPYKRRRCIEMFNNTVLKITQT